LKKTYKGDRSPSQGDDDSGEPFMRPMDEATSKKMSVEPQEKIDVANAELTRRKRE